MLAFIRNNTKPMIKFFRKIRRKFLREGKFRNYFFYALGEILLIVIGILIAVQINNLNENYQNRQLEDRYLRSLVNDLKRDNNILKKNC